MTKYSKFVIDLILVFLISNQSIISQYSFKYDSSNSILPEAGLRCVAVDSSGNFWVGGQNAPYRYSFKSEWVKVDTAINHQDKSGHITDIEVSQNGSIWVGKYNTSEKRLFLHKEDEWIVMPFDFGLTIPARIHIENDSLIYLTCENFWGNQIFYNEIGVFNGQDYTQFLPNEVVGMTSVIPFSKKTFMLTSWRGVSFYIDDTNYVSNPDYINKNYEGDPRWIPTLKKIDERIFIYNDQLFEHVNNEYISFPKIDSLLLEDSSKITCITVESDSIIWLGTDKGAIIRYEDDDADTEMTVHSQILDIAIYYEKFDSWSVAWKCFVTTNGFYVFNEWIHVGIEDMKNQIMVENYSLHQNYPNPFNPSTKISYSISNQEFVSLKVFDVLGREVASLVNEEQSVGNYSIEFDASSLTSGVYFYRIQAGRFVESKKMILLK